MQLNCNRMEIARRRSTRAMQIKDANHVLERLDEAERANRTSTDGWPQRPPPPCARPQDAQIASGPQGVDVPNCC
jgi:hypothetical protein